MGAYDELRTFADVKEAVGKARTHKALTALNDAINDRLWADQQQLILTDAENRELTRLMATKSGPV